MIPFVADSIAWDGLETGAFTWYMNDSSAFDCPYGKLYNWYAVDDLRGLCPVGWHSPSDSEFVQLVNYFHTELSGSNLLSAIYGGDRFSGFSGLKGGARWASDSYLVGEVSGFLGYSSIGNYWTTSAIPVNIWNSALPTRAIVNQIFSMDTTNSVPYFPRSGLSVRCLKD